LTTQSLSIFVSNAVTDVDIGKFAIQGGPSWQDETLHGLSGASVICPLQVQLPATFSNTGELAWPKDMAFLQQRRSSASFTVF
jgi:hypothetical protein